MLHFSPQHCIVHQLVEPLNHSNFVSENRNVFQEGKKVTSEYMKFVNMHLTWILSSMAEVRGIVYFFILGLIKNVMMMWKPFFVLDFFPEFPFTPDIAREVFIQVSIMTW